MTEKLPSFAKSLHMDESVESSSNPRKVLPATHKYLKNFQAIFGKKENWQFVKGSIYSIVPKRLHQHNSD